MHESSNSELFCVSPNKVSQSAITPHCPIFGHLARCVPHYALIFFYLSNYISYSAFITEYLLRDDLSIF